MKGIPVPDLEEDFTADPVELFFDLAYVIGFAQLVGALVHDATWSGFGRVALLFGLLWLPWQELTWAANAVSGNGRAVRVVFLAATAVSIPMAAATSTALGSGGPVFAVCLTLIMLLGFVTQGLSAEVGSGYQAAVVRWVVPNVVAIVVLLAGSAVDGQARIAVWAGALVIVLGAMVAAGNGEWVIRAGHFAERHGLIVIIALGEVIVAIGLPVVAALEELDGIPGRTVVALVASGVFGACMWWGYFDRVQPALEHRCEAIERSAQGRFVRDVYTWGHAPIVLGIILVATGLEETTLHPSDPLPVAFKVLLAGGLGLIVAGITGGIWRSFGVLPRERILGITLVAVLLIGWSPNAVVQLVAVDVALLAILVLEHRRIER